MPISVVFGETLIMLGPYMLLTTKTWLIDPLWGVTEHMKHSVKIMLTVIPVQDMELYPKYFLEFSDKALPVVPCLRFRLNERPTSPLAYLEASILTQVLFQQACK